MDILKWQEIRYFQLNNYLRLIINRLIITRNQTINLDVKRAIRTLLHKSELKLFQDEYNCIVYLFSKVTLYMHVLGQHYAFM